MRNFRPYAVLVALCVGACADKPALQTTDASASKPTIEEVSACYDGFNGLQQYFAGQLAQNLIKQSEENQKYPKTNWTNDPAHHSLSAFVGVLTSAGSLEILPQAAAQSCPTDPKAGLDTVKKLSDIIAHPETATRGLSQSKL